MKLAILMFQNNVLQKYFEIREFGTTKLFLEREEGLTGDSREITGNLSVAWELRIGGFFLLLGYENS